MLRFGLRFHFNISSGSGVIRNFIQGGGEHRLGFNQNAYNLLATIHVYIVCIVCICIVCMYSIQGLFWTLTTCGNCTNIHTVLFLNFCGYYHAFKTLKVHRVQGVSSLNCPKFAKACPSSVRFHWTLKQGFSYQVDGGSPPSPPAETFLIHPPPRKVSPQCPPTPTPPTPTKLFISPINRQFSPTHSLNNNFHVIIHILFSLHILRILFVFVRSFQGLCPNTTGGLTAPTRAPQLDFLSTLLSSAGSVVGYRHKFNSCISLCLFYSYCTHDVTCLSKVCPTSCNQTFCVCNSNKKNEML